MAEYTVSLSVVTYNNEKHIGRLLDSLHENVKGIPYHIYVIDNVSKDSTAQIASGRSDCITYIQGEKNVGFGEAHNKVLDLLDSKYHIVTNPDIFIDKDVITDIADYMDKNESIGLVSPKVYYPGGKLQLLPKRDPKLIYLISRRIKLGFLKKYRDEYEMNELGQDAAFDIEFATGCFMFMRTELFKKAGGFDKDFFMYFEDADLSRRLRKFARLEYNPSFYVYHNWERAGAKSLRLFFIQIKSMIYYFRKWKADNSKA